MAFAQRREADIFVGALTLDRAQYNTIQEAVNAATTGQIIEIIDSRTYSEQVTIDGSTTPSGLSLAPGLSQPSPRSGKNGITIRAGAGARPIVQFRDTYNTSPTSCIQAQNFPGDDVGQSNNFATNGAIRIIRASNITLEGLIIDGGGVFPFGHNGVWGPPGCQGQTWPLFHGNAAVAVTIAGNVQIRDCELRNAYFGIAVKDRNVGGVFGNPNPSDNDYTVPLSDFGRTGSHLFEYNRIHTNSVGIFFESSWDLGSTIRYNLIYRNFHHNQTLVTGQPGGDQDKNSGGISFKDNYLSPVAIYNNTFFENSGNFKGGWQQGFQHLIFNNIFARPNTYSGATPQNNMQGRFPFRMAHNVFSADQDRPNAASQGMGGNVVCGVVHHVGLVDLQMSSQGRIPCSGGSPGDSVNSHRPGAPIRGARDNMIFPDSSNRWLEMTGISPTGSEIPHASFPNLFLSITPTIAATGLPDPNFLVPDWSRPEVQNYIRNAGWPSAGILNEDGTIADLGAIPFNGKSVHNTRQQPARARVRPIDVVDLNVTTATVPIAITNEISGTNYRDFNSSFLRWIAPIPDNADRPGAGNGSLIVPATSVRPIVPLPTRIFGLNATTMTFTVPGGAVPEYGFFELAFQSESSDGRISTDIGFLPFRQLDWVLRIEVTGPNVRTTIIEGQNVPTVTAGDPVTVRVTAVNRQDGRPFPVQSGRPPALATRYSLASIDRDGYMWQGQPNATLDNMLAGDPDIFDQASMAFMATYNNIVFTVAGPNPDVISAGGVFDERSTNPVALRGSQLVLVQPGPPNQIAFSRPTSDAYRLAGSRPIAMNPGSPFEVRVEVRDRFGNAVNTAVPVSIAVDRIDVGTVAPLHPTTSTTDPATGQAIFMANVTNGVTGDSIKMTAASLDVTVPGIHNTGTLRVGVVLDALVILYPEDADGVVQNPSVRLECTKDQWCEVVVKAVSAGNVMNHSGFIQVHPNTNVEYAATSGGAVSADGVFPMTAGEARFWIRTGPGVTSNFSICLDVDALLSATPGHISNALLPGNRCDIDFIVPSTYILNAVVYSVGNGEGRPDSIAVRYDPTQDPRGLFGGLTRPTELVFNWPTPVSPPIRVPLDATNIVDTFTVGVSLRGLAAALPTGHTSVPVAMEGRGVVVMISPDNLMGDNGFPVLDGMGPIISSSADDIDGKHSPGLIENITLGTAAPHDDTLIVWLSEDLEDRMAFFSASSIQYVSGAANPNVNPPAAAVITDVAVSPTASTWSTALGAFRLVVPFGSGMESDGWIRINPASTIRDMAASSAHNHPSNGVQVNNRWVQLRLIEVPAEVESAYFTSDVTTGFLDYAYVTFNKPISSLENWFGNGYFVFTSALGVDTATVTPANIGDLLAPTTDPRQLRVNLGLAHPRSRNGIITAGSIPVIIGANPLQAWPAMHSVLSDRAKPVLADSVLLRFGAGEGASDTLVVIYSEVLSDISRGVRDPVVITTPANPGAEYILTLSNPVDVPAGGPGGMFRRVTYIIDASPIPVDSFARGNYFVHINTNSTTPVGDNVIPSNLQDHPDNHRVPLKIDRGKLNWNVIVQNNPFRDGGTATVVARSPATRGTQLNITGSVRVFDNMGNLVRDEAVDMQGVTEFNWPWNGRNSKGRFVGSGTYLFRATIQTEIVGSDEPIQRSTLSTSVGFVRGRR
jgi:hypothetical protein